MVKEMVIAGMLLASREYHSGGINWVQENEEDGNICQRCRKKKKHLPDRSWKGKARCHRS